MALGPTDPGEHEYGDTDPFEDFETGTGDDSPFARRLERYTSVDDPGRGAPNLIAGRYLLGKLIGRGSMGRIYLAEQVTVGRKVAVKIINRHWTTRHDTLARFQQEARLLASVQNEHVVDVYDIGETEMNDPFIVMEYVDGPSLAAVIRDEAPLDPVRTLRLLLQIASALAAVHAAGVVHRDLKPANIVLMRRGGAELAKILDFGLAKVIRDHERAGRLTRAGVIIGTPEYMSPEQVTGTQVDHRADLYSLGCTAYEMLTGRPPFTGAEMATLYKHLHEEVPPLQVAAPNTRVPDALEAAILRMLAKAPEERYPSAHHLFDALLRAADAAGIPRRSLHVDRGTLMDELHVVSVTTPAAASEAAAAPGRRPTQRSIEIALGVLAALAVGLVIGVLVSRQRGPAAAAGPERVETAGVAGAAAALGTAASGASAHASVVVSTRPAGALVSLDGRKPKAAPVAFKELAPGRHKLTITRRGYLPLEHEFDVAPGQATLLELSLEHPRYKTRIETEPPGAKVRVDLAEVGVTPLEVEITEGEFHEIEIHREGFRARTIQIDPDERQERIALTLEPALLHYGTLFVNSDNPGRVFIDGKDTGEWTPTGEIQLAPGRHEVTLVDNVGVQRSVKVTIVKGEVTNLDVP